MEIAINMTPAALAAGVINSPSMLFKIYHNPS